jgi:chemotaxis protein methyltransferase CheR
VLEEEEEDSFDTLVPAAPSTTGAGVASAADLGQIRAAADGGDLAGALAAIDRVLADEPLNAAPYLLKAQILHATGAEGQAIAELKRAAYLEPELAEVHLRLGLLLNITGDRAGAIRALRTALFLVSSVDEPSESDIVTRATAAGALTRLLKGGAL